MEVYSEAMQASIRNAEQWLADAWALLRSGSHAHARALQNLAGEESAKAFGCWLVANGLMPSDHPDVNFRGRDSVFGSHFLKNRISLLLGALALLPEITPGAVLGASIAVKAAASLGKRRRMEWMYVDIIETGGGHAVSNPLEMDVGDVAAGLGVLAGQISFLKTLIRGADAQIVETVKRELSGLFGTEG